MLFSRICWCKVKNPKRQFPKEISLKTAKPVRRELSPKDYCAGRGGKTWFLATLVAPNGTVCAWDIEEDLRKQLEGARAKRTLGELGFEFVGCGRFMFAGFLLSSMIELVFFSVFGCFWWLYFLFNRVFCQQAIMRISFLLGDCLGFLGRCWLLSGHVAMLICFSKLSDFLGKPLGNRIKWASG